MILSPCSYKSSICEFKFSNANIVSRIHRVLLCKYGREHIALLQRQSIGVHSYIQHSKLHACAQTISLELCFQAVTNAYNCGNWSSGSGEILS